LVAMLKDVDEDVWSSHPHRQWWRCPLHRHVRCVAEACRQGGVQAAQAGAFSAHFCPDTLRKGETTTLQQVGVAVLGGADRTIHSTCAYLEDHPDWACASIDCTNAFNALSREAMKAAVRARFPELVAFTKLCYDQPPPPLFFRMDRALAL
jgi:hypothetical protein